MTRRRPSLAAAIRVARTRAGSDRGYALLVVLGVGILMLALVAGALSTATTGMQRTDTENSWTSAYSAAVAGMNDYKARLSSASNYVKYGNPNAPFSAGSATLTLPTGSLDNPAFDIDSSGRWGAVPGSSSKAYFRYEVNTKDYALRGVIHVRATGKVGRQVRSVIADFRKKGFFDFVYFTQYEVQDWHITGQSSNCESYKWSSPARPTSGCNVVAFGRSDTLNGDIFSNDQFTSCGAVFNGSVTSAAPASYSPVVVTGTCAYPNRYNVATNVNTGTANPANGASIFIPADASPLKQEAQADTATGNGPGCMYTGPTVIRFTGDGNMNVISPWTQVTQPNSSGVGGNNPVSCGTPGTAAGQLGNVNGATVPVPADNVIYVQKVPNAPTDPNYPGTVSGFATGLNPNGSVNTNGTTLQKTVGGTTTTFRCFKDSTGYTGNINNTGMQGWSLTNGTTTIRYPRSDETYVPTPAGTDAYTCNAGDVYISGAVQGHVTVASDRYAYVTGDLTYTPTAPTPSNYNVLGLIATSAVIVWNPMKDNGNTPLLSNDRTIQAALLALNGTVMNQNYDTGPLRGTLTIKGSIAQNFRGAVATGNSSGALVTGYAKNYNYDENLRYNAPPKYLAPANISYGVSQVASVPAAWNVDGSRRP